MATKGKLSSEGPGAAGSHRGRGLTPDDYEAMTEDQAEGTLEELLGVTPERAREWDAEISARGEQSERDIASSLDARVNFRWGRAQVATVKRAADMAGVPYQTYIKLVTYRQAIADLQAADAMSVTPPQSPGRPRRRSG